MRVMGWPALVASSCHRRRRRRSAASSGSIFLSGCRSIPGTSPATSHADWLISRTAIRVLSGLRNVWDRLWPLSSGMGHSVVLPSDDGRARQLRVKILEKGELIDKPRFLLISAERLASGIGRGHSPDER